MSSLFFILPLFFHRSSCLFCPTFSIFLITYFYFSLNNVFISPSLFLSLLVSYILLAFHYMYTLVMYSGFQKQRNNRRSFPNAEVWKHAPRPLSSGCLISNFGSVFFLFPLSVSSSLFNHPFLTLFSSLLFPISLPQLLEWLSLFSLLGFR